MGILEAGMLTFVSFLLLAIKIPKKTLLTLLGMPLTCDVTVTLFLFWLYHGSVTGLMAATLSALMFSVCISAARFLIGFIDKGQYHPGYFDIW